MSIANTDVRNAVKASGFKLWELADALGIYDGNLSRKLRKELSHEQKEHVFETLEMMANERSKHERN